MVVDDIESGADQEVAETQPSLEIVAPGGLEDPVTVDHLQDDGMRRMEPVHGGVNIDQVDAATGADQRCCVVDDRLLARAVVGQDQSQHGHIDRARAQPGGGGITQADLGVAHPAATMA
jgi:hypothetical protein